MIATCPCAVLGWDKITLCVREGETYKPEQSDICKVEPSAVLVGAKQQVPSLHALPVVSQLESPRDGLDPARVELARE